MRTDLSGEDWTPDACTLPTLERPLRRSEFDDLFSRDTLTVVRESPDRIRLELRPDPIAAARAADLAAKESGCCSFFTFQLAIADGQVSLMMRTAPAHRAVLDVLVARAAARAGATRE